MTIRSALIRSASLAAIALLAGGMVAPASASTITMQTRASTASAQSSAAGYQSTIDALVAVAPTSGYGDSSLTSFASVSNQSTLHGSSSNIAFKYTIDFSAASAGSWEFRVAPDFGKGGAVYLDGTAVAFKSSDMWWGGSWSNSSQIFDFTSTLSTGNHTLTIYGLEGCCDGSQQAQFKAAGSGSFTTFGSTDGAAPVAVVSGDGHTGVPEPRTVVLFGVSGLALSGLLWRRRQRRDVSAATQAAPTNLAV